jgi:hypothetical protein
MAQPLEVEQTLRPSISQILQQHGDPAGQIYRSQILKSSNSQILIFSDPAAAW